MDVPRSPSIPLGPMTRSRAKAIEDKVNSLLLELPFSTHESWILPQAETLCVLRYLEEVHVTSTFNGQDGADTKREGQEGELPQKLHAPDDQPRMSDPWLRPVADRGPCTPSLRHSFAPRL